VTPRLVRLLGLMRLAGLAGLTAHASHLEAWKANDHFSPLQGGPNAASGNTSTPEKIAKQLHS
jgi:hypothetical protein